MDKIYVVTTTSFIDEEQVGGCLRHFYATQLEAINAMLRECQQLEGEWRQDPCSEVITDYGTEVCEVCDDHAGDWWRWEVRELTAEGKEVA